MCSDGERDVLLHGAERTSNITPSGHTVTARLSCTRTPTHPSQTMPSLVTMSRSSTPRVPRRARRRAERERYRTVADDGDAAALLDRRLLDVGAVGGTPVEVEPEQADLHAEPQRHVPHEPEQVEEELERARHRERVMCADTSLRDNAQGLRFLSSIFYIVFSTESNLSKWPHIRS